MTPSWKTRANLGGIAGKKAEKSSFLIFKVSGQYHPPEIINRGLPRFFICDLGGGRKNQQVGSTTSKSDTCVSRSAYADLRLCGRQTSPIPPTRNNKKRRQMPVFFISTFYDCAYTNAIRVQIRVRSCAGLKSWACAGRLVNHT